jgi:DNA polymerase III alpha subunit (gram-positive type)
VAENPPEESVNILWVDVETTGLDKRRHGIIQIAGMVEVNGEIAESFNLPMNPEAEFDPVSREIHGITPAQIARYPSRQETFDRFEAVLLRYVDVDDPATRLSPGGYNVRFDLGFLDQWFRAMKEPGLAPYFRRERVDPSVMMKAFQDYLGKGRMPSWSLRAVAAKMGLSLGEQHDALEDIKLTRNIHRRILSFFTET